jgi:hypothetical protein
MKIRSSVMVGALASAVLGLVGNAFAATPYNLSVPGSVCQSVSSAPNLNYHYFGPFGSTGLDLMCPLPNQRPLSASSDPTTVIVSYYDRNTTGSGVHSQCTLYRNNWDGVPLFTQTQTSDSGSVSAKTFTYTLPSTTSLFVYNAACRNPSSSPGNESFITAFFLQGS